MPCHSSCHYFLTLGSLVAELNSFMLLTSLVASDLPSITLFHAIFFKNDCSLIIYKKNLVLSSFNSWFGFNLFQLEIYILIDVW